MVSICGCRFFMGTSVCNIEAAVYMYAMEMCVFYVCTCFPVEEKINYVGSGHFVFPNVHRLA